MTKYQVYLIGNGKTTLDKNWPSTLVVESTRDAARRVCLELALLIPKCGWGFSEVNAKGEVVSSLDVVHALSDDIEEEGENDGTTGTM